MLKPGLYEKLINAETAKALAEVPEERKASAPVDAAEAPVVLSAYVADAVRKRLEDMGDSAPEKQVSLVNNIISLLGQKEQQVEEPAAQLTALLEEKSLFTAAGKSIKDLPRPETSIAMSSLFTGARHEPAMFAELKKEIVSSDRIDMLVSFIKWSGLRLILEELTDFTQRGGRLRIITTSYMGATEVKAIEALSKLPNTEIRVSYDTKRTRLHAKTYVFYRDTGFTTAYIGSSNLSNAAISSGMEWNVKVTAKDQPDVLRKVMATFDAYWNTEEFEAYTDESHDRLRQALKAEQIHGEPLQYLFDIRPYPYQQEILDRLRAEREVRGHYRNLVVAATGTGKTVIAALDYRGFARSRPGQGNRLLFLAHREEILKQSLMTFRGVLRDANFGALWVGNYQPDRLDHVFLSVQTMNTRKLWEQLPSDYYDYIVVDETHHAAADSYDRALNYFKPRILLGLTATPERMDGKSILDYFDQRIAAEIRLPEAIDRKLLCPFQYFGVSDTIDLDDLHWVRGGYDRKELSNLYTLSGAIAGKRADHVLQQVDKYTADMDQLKALGFCVSVEHARFMAKHFTDAGVPAISLDGNSTDEERHQAQGRLVSGDIKAIFVVDLYNEGVDIPEVNTILFLRPTESLTIFLQQLGRGLRLCEGKDCLTVLDFIGAANRKYNFEQKFAALLTDDHPSVEREVKRGFLSVPKGCYIQLEKKAQKIILDNIRASYGARRGLVSKIASFTEDTGMVCTLANFLQYYNMDARSLYKWDSFAQLCAEASIRPAFDEPAKAVVTKALIRVAAMDSRRWIAFLLQVLPKLNTLDFNTLTEEQRLMLSMFHATLWGTATEDFDDEIFLTHVLDLINSPVMMNELLQLLQYRYDSIDFIDTPNSLPYVCPLDVHCTYSRDQLLCALGFNAFNAVREGVKYLEERKTDVFFITLNKSDKDYSPTTMYNDYAVTPTLFHWQSQSTTAPESVAGQRYIHHQETGNHILLFVRSAKKDNWGTAAYTFLGEAQYVRHEGSRPMNMWWQLAHPIPAKYIRKVQQVLG